jgi:hypothetical protein
MGIIARRNLIERRRSSSSFDPGASSSSISEVDDKDMHSTEVDKGGEMVEMPILRFLQSCDPPLDFWHNRLVDYGLDNIPFLNSFAKWPTENIEKILNGLATDGRFPTLTKFQTQCLVKHLADAQLLSQY